MQCIFTHGLNRKRLFMAVAAVFAFIFVTDFLVHGMLLKEAYLGTATLWRTEGEMGQYRLWMLLAQFVISFFLCTIYARGHEGKGLSEGFRFGMLIGPFMMAPSFVYYAVMPITCQIGGVWAVTALLQGIGASVIAASLYRKS